jgi:CobQ/CobB/MinD/ParA nucleotide binding domain
MKETLKTVLFLGNNKGGIGKSFSALTLADALDQLGYTVEAVDADPANKTLSESFSGEIKEIDASNQIELDNYLKEVIANSGSENSKDFYLIDLPGEISGKIIAEYFKKRSFQSYRKLGIRVLCGVVINKTSDSINGAIAWIEAFKGLGEYLIITNQMRTEGKPFTLTDITGGEILENISKGKVINIPELDVIPTTQWEEFKAKPSSFLEGGEAFEALNLNFVDASQWEHYLNELTDSIREHSLWLTGKPPLKYPKYSNEYKNSSVDSMDSKGVDEIDEDAEAESIVTFADQLKSALKEKKQKKKE